MIKHINAYRYLSYLLGALAIFTLTVGFAFWQNAASYFYYWLIACALLAAGAAIALKGLPPQKRS